MELTAPLRRLVACCALVAAVVAAAGCDVETDECTATRLSLDTVAGSAPQDLRISVRLEVAADGEPFADRTVKFAVRDRGQVQPNYCSSEAAVDFRYTGSFDAA